MFKSKLLGDISTIVSGYSFRGAVRYDDYGFPVIQIKDLSGNYIYEDNLNLVDVTLSSAEKYVANRDILLTNKSIFIAAQYIAEEDQLAVASSSLLIIKIIDKSFTPEYIVRWLNLPSTQRKIYRFAKGAAIKTVSIDDLESLEVPVIPLEQQQLLTELSDVMDAQYTLLRKKADVYKNLKNEILFNKLKGHEA